jgi:hypothetical protein
MMAALTAEVHQGNKAEHSESGTNDMQQRKRTASLDMRMQAEAGAVSTSYRTGSAPPRQRGPEDDSPPDSTRAEDTSRDRSVTISADPATAVSAAAGPSETLHIEPLLADGLRIQKDRMLLLRSDLEIEKFVGDAS